MWKFKIPKRNDDNCRRDGFGRILVVNVNNFILYNSIDILIKIVYNIFIRKKKGMMFNMEKEYKLIPMTFFWMFLGLLGTAIVSIYAYQTDLCYELVKGGYFEIILIVELLVVIIFSLLFRKLPPLIVGILYFVYAMINGLSLSTIFYVFELQSIIILFVASATLFAGLGLYGYFTQKDISRWQPILMWALIIGLILSIINIFLGNSFLDIMLDWAIIITFFGVTIYDMNRLKALALDENINQEKVHIYCAMQLYLDFINIFIRLLSIFGRRRD